MHKKILLLALISCSMQATDPAEFVFHKPNISTKTKLLTAGTGIGAAYATHYGIASLFNYFGVTSIPVNMLTTIRIPVTNWLHLDFSGFGRCSIRNPNVIKALIIGTAGLVGTIAALCMYANQPEGAFHAAQSRLTDAIEDDVLNELINAQQQLLHNIDTEYIEYTYPRVTAYHDFMRFHTNLKEAAQWLKEAQAGSSDDTFIAMADDYINIIHYYLEHISSCMHIIRSEPDWLKQLKGYEMQKTREAQERLVVATQMAALNNHHYVYMR